ncbi:MAG: hypothetical protein GWP10_11615 [Nitrospiraceae bacterium]|nr:hypothetical protein [Nitrospiraceae bacterium]
MTFLADENIPYAVIKRLRELGVEIISVLEEFRGLNDEKIIEISSEQRLIIITFDKDFGYLVFRRMVGVPFGVILLRIPLRSSGYIFKMLKWTLLESRIKFERNFVVVTESKVRVVPLGRLG